jgi:hypothetical protein
MLALLKNLITSNPFVDEVDFEAQEIDYFDPHAVELLGRFTELKKVRILTPNKLFRLTCLRIL